jgi:hypothetical protein
MDERTLVTLREAFSAPYNWCDRRCERCPLAEDCPVHRKALQREWVHEARGSDPDDIRVILDDIAQIFERVIIEVTDFAKKEGIKWTSPSQPSPSSLMA